MPARKNNTTNESKPSHFRTERKKKTHDRTRPRQTYANKNGKHKNQKSQTTSTTINIHVDNTKTYGKQAKQQRQHDRKTHTKEKHTPTDTPIFSPTQTTAVAGGPSHLNLRKAQVPVSLRTSDGRSPSRAATVSPLPPSRVRRCNLRRSCPRVGPEPPGTFGRRWVSGCRSCGGCSAVVRVEEIHDGALRFSSVLRRGYRCVERLVSGLAVCFSH